MVYTLLGSDHWTNLHPIIRDKSFVDVVASRLRGGLFYAVKYVDLEGSIVSSLDFSSSTSTDVAYTDITLNLRDDFLFKSEEDCMFLKYDDM